MNKNWLIFCLIKKFECIRCLKKDDIKIRLVIRNGQKYKIRVSLNYNILKSNY